MTTSNIAANIITDKIKSDGSVYGEIFKSTRFKPIENKDEMKNMIVDSTKSLVVERIKKRIYGQLGSRQRWNSRLF